MIYNIFDNLVSQNTNDRLLYAQNTKSPHKMQIQITLHVYSSLYGFSSVGAILLILLNVGPYL